MEFTEKIAERANQSYLLFSLANILIYMIQYLRCKSHETLFISKLISGDILHAIVLMLLVWANAKLVAWGPVLWIPIGSLKMIPGLGFFGAHPDANRKPPGPQSPIYHYT